MFSHSTKRLAQSRGLSLPCWSPVDTSHVNRIQRSWRAVGLCSNDFVWKLNTTNKKYNQFISLSSFAPFNGHNLGDIYIYIYICIMFRKSQANAVTIGREFPSCKPFWRRSQTANGKAQALRAIWKTQHVEWTLSLESMEHSEKHVHWVNGLV